MTGSATSTWGTRAPSPSGCSSFWADLKPPPVPCGCDIEQQYARFGGPKPVLKFWTADGEVGALSRTAPGELLSIFPRRHWQEASVRLLESTHFENDEGKQYLVPVVDVTLQTAFG